MKFIYILELIIGVLCFLFLAYIDLKGAIILFYLIGVLFYIGYYLNYGFNRPFTKIINNFPSKNWQWIFIIIGFPAILNLLIIHTFIFLFNRKEEKTFFGSYFKRRLFFIGWVISIILIFQLLLFIFSY